MPNRFAFRLNEYEKYQWLRDSRGLDGFNWRVQPQTRISALKWLVDWHNRLFHQEERPKTLLFIWGPNGLGKTTLAKALAKFSLQNNGFASVGIVQWSDFVDDKLNDGLLEIDWNVKLLVLDDLDGRRPLGRSMDTWLLDFLAGKLKRRCETLGYPTIVVLNRNPKDLYEMLSTNSAGARTKDTMQSADTLMDLIARNMYQTIEFNRKQLPQGSRMNIDAAIVNINIDENRKMIDKFFADNDWTGEIIYG